MYRNISLHGTGCANAHYIQVFFLGLDFFALQVDIHEGIKFVHHDVYVVGTDTCGNNG